MDFKRDSIRLASAINGIQLASNVTDVFFGDTDQASQSQKLVHVLKYIDLQLRKGLDAVWMATHPQGGLTQSVDHEEAWARQYSEMFLGLPYMSPETAYAHKTDRYFFNQMLPGSSGAYPITACCQQLCTFAMITRGFTTEHFNYGVNAAGNSGLPAFQSKSGGHFHKPEGGRDALEAEYALTKLNPPIKQGSMFEFYKGTLNAEDSGSHIGFVLRVHHNPSLIQVFDTSGLNIGDEKDGLGVGIKDYPWATRIEGPKLEGGEVPFTGVGVLPEVTAEFLNVATEAMRKKWPLGFARLVIFRRLPNPDRKNPLYCTPLLRMHYHDYRFYPSKYIWSLRGMPYSDELLAEWHISVPRNGFVETCIKHPNNSTKRLVCINIKDANRIPILLTNDYVTAHSTLRVDECGKVKIMAHLGKHAPPRTERYAWACRSGSILPKLDEVPLYLRGNQQPAPLGIFTTSTMISSQNQPQDWIREGSIHFTEHVQSSEKKTYSYFNGPGRSGPGTISGIVKNTTMEGEWESSDCVTYPPMKNRGKFKIEFNADFDAFNGDYESDDNTESGAWSGHTQ